jgi:type VI secretion system protein ImpI
MELIFEIVSYHRLSPEQTSKKSINESITFGRSESNDWHLPDPEKVVSGTHAKIERKSNNFFIYDLSTNGLYINRSVEALGLDNPHKLLEGDLLTFGDYEVAVSFITTDKPTTAADNSDNLFNNKQVAVDIYPPEVQGFNSANLVGNSATTSNEQHDIMPPVISNDLNDHFEVPQAIPEEWDVDFLNGNPDESNNPPMTSFEEVPVKNIEIESEKKSEQSGFAQLIDSNDNARVNATSFDAFIDGLGLSVETLPDTFSDKLMYELGQGMQLMLLGLMESLRNRSTLKNEYRINQTTFQQQENNPLKFSASIDDVFQNLFLRRSSSFLPADKAISEAFNDTKKHDIALTAGTLGAIKGILSQLDPLEIESRDLKESLLDQVLPGQRQLRYWKMYQSLHKDMGNDIASQGSSALSDEFVRAYDKKIKSLEY